MSELEDPEIISLPYLSFYYSDKDKIIFRAGETGEFGYYMLYPQAEACEFWKQALKIGVPFDLIPAGNEALEYCALENMFFNVGREGAVGASPAELQLQWRIDYRKQFAYHQALSKTRQAPLARRLTGVHSRQAINPRDMVYYEGKVIGRIMNAHRFLSGDGYIGLAMLDRYYAESGIPGYQCQGAEEKSRIRTVSPPFVNNFSLAVDPQIHSYLDKDDIVFPPISAIKYEQQLSLSKR
jgi:glycine cleavage system aminomethyltransferase T